MADLNPNEQSLERHLTDKIGAVEISLTEKIVAVENNLTNRIVGVEKFFTAENRSAKDAVSIAMTAAEKAAQKTEIAADERSRTQTTAYTTMLDGVMKRLDQIDKAIAESGGWQHGVGSSLATTFQIISSIGVAIGIIYILMKH
jgi:flagellin-like hook-associated protein FlgL